MNRSVVLYYENQELEEGILGSVKDHLSRNWGKYALSAAAVGTGGALLANPALATSAGAALSKGAVSAGKAVGSIAGKTTKALGGSSGLANKISGGIAGAGKTAGKALTTAGKTVRKTSAAINQKVVPLRDKLQNYRKKNSVAPTEISLGP